MKCKWCDQEVKHEDEHYKDVRDDNDMPILECSGWTCDGGIEFWRDRALKAEAIVAAIEKGHDEMKAEIEALKAKGKMLEENIKSLWSTTNA